MHLSLTPNNLAAYIQKQLSNIFPDDGDVSKVIRENRILF